MSKRRDSSLLILCLGVFAILIGPSAGLAQTKAEMQSDGRNRLAHLTQLEPRFGPHFTDRLSSGGATMFHVAKMLSDRRILGSLETTQKSEAMAKAVARHHAKTSAIPVGTEQAEDESSTRGPVPVNDADLDYEFSRFAGFTQSETSSAWCGNSVVAGFNDSGALIRTVVERVGGTSFTGVATSHNRGRSFVGLPFLNPGPDPGTFLGGDPVLVCSDAEHFLYASLLSQVNFDAQGNLITNLTGISLSRSRTGGLIWDNPTPAVTKDANFNFLDKEWMAIDPHNPNHLYITYTDFQAHGAEGGCPPIQPGVGSGPDVNIEVVTSKDGGNSWNAPVRLDRVCSLIIGQNLSGTQVVVGPKGQVYVAYTFIDQKNAEMRLRRSDDGGASFGPTVVVAEATNASSIGFDHLEGNFRTTAFPTLAVDIFGDKNQGTLYMAWPDAGRNQAPDIVANVFFNDTVYSFGDIVLSVSRDGGSTWSTPNLVSRTPANFNGTGRDQFMPGVAVDSRGTLAVCYSDRRNDPNNQAIDHFCSLSRDQGRTFKDVRETPKSWSPGHTTDFFVNPAYMGDYDAVSVDTTAANAGFFSTFQMQTNTNPDVFGMRLHF